MDRSVFGPSFKLGRFLGIDVWIHWTLFAVLLFYATRAQMRGAPLEFVIFAILIPYLLLFGSVLLHEFGHILAARRFGMYTDFVILTPIGGAAIVGESRNPWEEFVVAISGPLVNVVLATLATGLYLLLGGRFSLGMWIPFLDDTPFYLYLFLKKWHLFLLYDFVEMQIILFLFNMLVFAYPMDGGRVLRSILWHFYGVAKGTILSCRVAKFAAAAMGAFALAIGDLFLLIIAIFVFWEAHMEESRYTYFYGWQKSIPYEHRYGRGETREEEESEEEFERELDRILAKVDREGMQSLTEKEKEFLKRASEKYRRKQGL